MYTLYLTDRLSLRGGADQHLLQVIYSTFREGSQVVVAFGRLDRDPILPRGVETVRIKGLASSVSSGARLRSLQGLLDGAAIVHVQNVMNPVVLKMAATTGCAVVTVQDHRFFCPGQGKSLPDGRRCQEVMSPEACETCLPDREYRERTLALTRARLDSTHGARIIVLSRYMASELEAVGAPGADIIPPWIETEGPREDPGSGFVLGGRLVQHKAPIDGWQAWRFSKTGHPLLVAGEGPLGLEGKLPGAEHLGWLKTHQLRELLRGARGLLFPTHWQEPFGILAVEALAEGTPVIVAESGGTSEWSDVGCIGVPVGDIAAMASAISTLADTPEQALRLGLEGQRMVSQRFSRSRIERTLHKLYDEARRR